LRASQVFNDPVHGHIFLSGLACDIMGARLKRRQAAPLSASLQKSALLALRGPPLLSPAR
jgi:hypothetical protein